MTAIEARKSFSSEAASAIEFARSLIRIRSTAGSPGSARVLEAAQDYLKAAGIKTRMLGSRPRSRALVASVAGEEPGPTLCLNACADTAPIGDARSWDVAPLAAEVVDGWVYGRGSADSKIAVAIFCEVMKYWAREGLAAGRLIACFDGDEHTGKFEGIQRFADVHPDVDAVMIGYPGQDAIRVGARGFWRCSITVFGVGQHSGSRREPRNAIVKATALVQALTRSAGEIAHNGLGPQLTVTGIRGGTGFSTVPDSCVVRVDVRLTPEFDAEAALAVVQDAVQLVDADFPYDRASVLRLRSSWPPYELDDDAPVVRALSQAVEEVFGEALSHQIAGPSNVGNLFAARGVPATCGFGVVHQGVHAPNEAFEVASVPGVLEVYVRAAGLFTGNAAAVA